MHLWRPTHLSAILGPAQLRESARLRRFRNSNSESLQRFSISLESLSHRRSVGAVCRRFAHNANEFLIRRHGKMRNFAKNSTSFSLNLRDVLTNDKTSSCISIWNMEQVCVEFQVSSFTGSNTQKISIGKRQKKTTTRQQQAKAARSYTHLSVRQFAIIHYNCTIRDIYFFRCNNRDRDRGVLSSEKIT